MTCDVPACHVCRITYCKPMDLPEEPSEITNHLFSILTTVFKARQLIENTRRLVRGVPVSAESNRFQYQQFPSCFHTDQSKKDKRTALMLWTLMPQLSTTNSWLIVRVFFASSPFFFSHFNIINKFLKKIMKSFIFMMMVRKLLLSLYHAIIPFRFAYKWKRKKCRLVENSNNKSRNWGTIV